MASAPPAVTSGGVAVKTVSNVGGSGCGNTVHWYRAGVSSKSGSPSMLVKRLTARTSNSCSSPLSGSPVASGPAVKGDVHGVHSDPSTEHWKGTPSASVWSEENVKVPLPPKLGSVGLESTLGGSAMSSARTRRLCEPVASPTSSCTASQPSHGPLSSEHSNSEASSVLRKANITSAPLVEPSAGPEKMTVSGAVVSTGALISHS